MLLEIDDVLQEKFPNLEVIIGRVSGVKVKNSLETLEEFKQDIVNNVSNKYSLETLKDVPIFRAYRDFFWRVSIDPTKVRPAAEALIRRVLSGKELPLINTFVDAYNLASIESEIALAAFDAEKINGSLMMRQAIKGEEFWGIGMEKPLMLKGNEIVIVDESKLLAIYPYRDADSTKIDLTTTEALIMSCGVPGIGHNKLSAANELAVDYITRFCGGNTMNYDTR
jgi:DNA/RNA-binding domain of Phe-tRNA-synthetase-like protein